MADIELLRYLARKTGLGLNYLSKDEKISIILEQVRDLFPEVVLKGGTAINRVYLAKKEVSRFSEDIDLDFISDKALNERIGHIKERVTGLSGFDVEGPRILHRTLRFDCYYRNEFGQRDRVQLEFYLSRIEALKAEEILVKSPFIETHPVIFTVYSLEALIASKFIALYNRQEGKDMYDLFFCLDEGYNRGRLEEALQFMLEFYKMSEADFQEGLLERLGEGRKNAFYIGNSTNHFIPRDLRPEWKIFIDTLKLKIEKSLGWGARI